MEITNEVKQRIAGAIAADRENYPSDNRHATALGIAASVYNAIKKRELRKAGERRQLGWHCPEAGCAVAHGNAVDGRQDPDLRVHQQAAGGVPGQRPECHSVRHAEHRQDLHGKGLREAAQERRVRGLLAGEDEAEADTLYRQGVRRWQLRTLLRRVRRPRGLPAHDRHSACSAGRGGGFAI